MKLYVAAFASVLALTAGANAADAIVDEVPVAVEMPFSWTGFYVGGFGAIGAGDNEYGVDITGLGQLAELEFTSRGGFIGGQVGYDYQMNNFVLGAYTDIALTNFEAELDGNLGGTEFGISSELQYFGTVQGRLGYAWDRALFYAHGGWAYGETEQSGDIGGAGFELNDGDLKSGFVVGAGVEYAFTDSISFQTDYSYVDLGEDDVFSQDPISVSEGVTFHMVKAAVNFRF